jgi:hypothetical protein
MKANHEDHKIPFKEQDILIKRGQFVTGRKEALKELKPLTVQTWKSALSYLKSTHRINLQANNKFSIITVCNYDFYQCYENESNQPNQPTNKQPITNQQPTSNHKQELKNVKNLKKEEDKEEKKFIPPTEEQVITYFKEKGYKTDIAKKAFLYYTELEWHDSTGKPIKNWKAKMVAVWFKEENKDITLTQMREDRKNHKPD